MLRAWRLLVPATIALLYLVALGNVPLQLPDEPREAAIAREMWVNGPLSVPTVNGVHHAVKPPLAYWTASAIIGLRGDEIPRESSVRLASALFTLATAAAVFAFGRAWFSVRHGILAAIIFAASPQVVASGRRFISDPALTFFLTVAIGLGLAALRRTTPRFLALAAAAGLSLGLAFLAKGPIAVVFTALVLGGAIVASLGNDLVASRRAPVIAGVMALALLPALGLWLWLLWREGGSELVRWWIDFHLGAFRGTPGISHARPWWFYIVRGPDGFLPWLLLLPLAWARRHALAARPGALPLRQLCAWILGPLVFLSVMSQKRDLYTLPVFPPLALLASCAILELRERTALAAGGRRLWSMLAPVLRALGLLGPLVGAGWALARGEWAHAAAGAGLCLLACGIFAGSRRDRSEREAPLAQPIGTASLAALALVAGIVFVEPQARAENTLRPLAREITAGVEDALSLYGYRLGDGTGCLTGALSFELGRTFPDLTRAAALREVLETDPEARVIANRRDYDQAGRPGRIVAAWTDGDRDLVLIARGELLRE